MASRYDVDAEDLTPEALPAPWPGRRTRTRDLQPVLREVPALPELPRPRAAVASAPDVGEVASEVRGVRARFADRAGEAAPPAVFEVRASYSGEPTWADRIRLARWQATLECSSLLRPDLVEATAAYRHFLLGLGAPRAVDYERYVAADPAGEVALASAIDDALVALHDRMAEQEAGPWRLRSDVVAVGSGNPRYPYPRGEDWQKALGAHALVIDVDAGRVEAGEADGDDARLAVTVCLRVESSYAFTGDSDDEADNDALVRSGLAHPFVHRGACTRRLVIVPGDELDAG